MSVESIGNYDRIINLLTKLKCYREPDLVVKGYPDRPVFSYSYKKEVHKVIVGPLWTTYYDLYKSIIDDIDSVKTNDYCSVENIIKELCDV